MINRDNRKDALDQWLSDHLQGPYSMAPASEDASFRRYFRIQQDNKSWIAMDAPPEKEGINEFIKIAQQLEQLSLNVPHIFQYDTRQGFILCSDLGKTDYLNSLNPDTADRLYQDAIDKLLIIQSKATHTHLPSYNESFLKQELALFPEWFLKTHLQLPLSEQNEIVMEHAFDIIVRSACEQPSVFVHRDYHSRNLMHCKSNNPGILDFQGALSGPITYDIASLLRDCYIEWPDDKVYHWLKKYHSQLLEQNLIKTELTGFKRWFDLMAMQRHLKVLGIFARLYHRDNKASYLQDIPRVFNYILNTSKRYDDLAPFYNYMQSINLKYNTHLDD